MVQQMGFDSLSTTNLLRFLSFVTNLSELCYFIQTDVFYSGTDASISFLEKFI
jgi:hypothetical protein